MNDIDSAKDLAQCPVNCHRQCGPSRLHALADLPLFHPSWLVKEAEVHWRRRPVPTGGQCRPAERTRTVRHHRATAGTAIQRKEEHTTNGRCAAHMNISW